MSKEHEVRSRLMSFAGQVGPIQTMIGTVTSVDEDGPTCIMEDDDGIEYGPILLRFVTNGKVGRTEVPQEGTYGFAIRREDTDDWVLIACDQIKDVIIQVQNSYSLSCGNVQYDLDSTGHTIKNGTDDLKDALTLIIESVQQIVVIYGNNPDYEKLTQALTKINNILK